MSTPGLIRLIADGQTKTHYIHWDGDSYDGELREWLRTARDSGLREAVVKLKVVSDFGPGKSVPTYAERRKLKRYEDEKVGGPDEHWYRLLRLTQGHPNEILSCGYMYDGTDCDADYEYVINTDKCFYQQIVNGRRKAKIPFKDL